MPSSSRRRSSSHTWLSRVTGELSSAEWISAIRRCRPSLRSNGAPSSRHAAQSHPKRYLSMSSACRRARVPASAPPT
eukprot:4349647-Prymnesium_polylepis.1